MAESMVNHIVVVAAADPMDHHLGGMVHCIVAVQIGRELELDPAASLVVGPESRSSLGSYRSLPLVFWDLYKVSLVSIDL